MRIRYFAMLVIVTLLGAGLIYPIAAHALSALCAPGSSGTAAPTPTPTPTPAFIQAANSNLSNTVTFSSAAAGELAVIFACSNAGAGTSAVNSPMVMNPNLNMGGGPPNGIFELKQINPADVTASGVITFTASAPSFGATCGVLLSHVFGLNESINTVKTNSSTSTILTNTYTTTIANDVGIWAACIQGSTNDITAAPAGYTMDANAHVAASASHQGCALAYNLNVGAAGTQTVGNATASLGAGSVATAAFGIFPYTAAY